MNDPKNNNNNCTVITDCLESNRNSCWNNLKKENKFRSTRPLTVTSVLGTGVKEDLVCKSVVEGRRERQFRPKHYSKIYRVNLVFTTHGEGTESGPEVLKGVHDQYEKWEERLTLPMLVWWYFRNTPCTVWRELVLGLCWCPLLAGVPGRNLTVHLLFISE